MVKAIVWIHQNNGDTSGHNNMIGSSNSSNLNKKYGFRDCCCPTNIMDSSTSNCTLFTLHMYHTTHQTSTGLDRYSKYYIDNAFIDVPISDQVHGIFGVTMSEMLHVMGNGLSKYMFQSGHDIIGPKDQERKEKEDFDDLFAQLVNDVHRQSERSFPHFAIRSGVLDDT